MVDFLNYILEYEKVKLITVVSMWLFVFAKGWADERNYRTRRIGGAD